MRPGRLLLLVFIGALVAAFFVFDLGQYLSLDFFKSQQVAIEAYRAAHPWQTALIYFAIYVAVTGLSLPGAALMTLVGGAVFGLAWGVVIVSFASTIGATLAFLASRYVLRDAVRRRFGERLAAIDSGMARDGAFYLFTLRLVPVFPFFVINVAMGLTPIRTAVFYGVSQLGMLPATLVYVNAGREIGQIESLAGILSPGLLLSFALLGLFPLIAKKVVLNTGCVPSKALIRTAKLLSHIRRAPELGIRSASADFDFAEVMERVQRVVRSVEPHDSAERYAGLGVEVLQGSARITSPWTVEVDDGTARRELTTRAIVIATGGTPAVPQIAGIEDVGYLTSDTVWDLRVKPERLLVLGGGPIGCELAQCFARLGSHVTQVQRGPRLLPKEDPEISALLMDRFRAEGIDLRLGHVPVRFERDASGTQTLICEHAGEQVEIRFDELLVAVGRTANTRGLGLDALGIPVRCDGTVQTDPYLRTVYPNVYAAGDVAGPYQFTHSSASRRTTP